MAWRLGVVVGLAAVCLTAACATTESAETAAATAEGAGEPVTCRRILLPGSNVEQQVCDTEEGWRDYDRRRRNQSQDIMRRMQGFGGAS